MPRNYSDLIVGLMAQCPQIQGLVIHNNADLKTFMKGLGLFVFGAPRIGTLLLKNFITSFFGGREAAYRAQSLPVNQFENLNSDEALSWIRLHDFDLILNLRTRCIYSKQLLSIPKIGCVNLHHGLLPDDRGTLCDLWALSEGRYAGFSLHEMTSKLDDGRIFDVQTVDSGNEKNFYQYLLKTKDLELKSLENFIHTVSELGHLPEGQDNTSNSIKYFKSPKIKDLRYLRQRGMSL